MNNKEKTKNKNCYLVSKDTNMEFVFSAFRVQFWYGFKEGMHLRSIKPVNQKDPSPNKNNANRDQFIVLLINICTFILFDTRSGL